VVNFNIIEFLLMVIRRFEELKSWQISREMTAVIYKKFSSRKDYGFWDQITRSSISVMNNISEGFESGTDKEFIRYLGYAKSSCGEVRSMVYIALDIGYLDDKTHFDLLEKCKKTSGAIYGLIKYLKQSQKK
jgi:four helix bundle protein